MIGAPGGGGGVNGRHRYASELHFHFEMKVQNAVISQIENEKEKLSNSN